MIVMMSVLVFIMMFVGMILEYGVRNIAVSNNLKWAIVSGKLFFSYHIRWMIMQIGVHAGNRFHEIRNGAHIVRNNHDRHFAVELLEQFIHFVFETVVNKGVGFVED